MRKIVAIVLSVLFGNVLVAQKNFIDQNYIQLQAYAERELVPDRIYLSVQINEEDNKAKETVDVLERKMIKELEAIGINCEEQLAIADFSNAFKSQFLRNSNLYAVKQYQLLVFDTQTLSKVFLKLAEIGIGNIEIDKVDHSDIEKIKSSLRVEAMQRAMINAKELANALGQEAGRAIYIRQYESFVPRFQKQERGMAQMAIHAEFPEIDFQMIKVEYKAEVYFELN